MSIPKYYKLAVNFNLKSLKKSLRENIKKFDPKDFDDWVNVLQKTFKEVDEEAWSIRRYDTNPKLIKPELIFLNLDTGLSQYGCTMDNENLPVLFNEFTSSELDQKWIDERNDSYLIPKNNLPNIACALTNIYHLNQLNNYFSQKIVEINPKTNSDWERMMLKYLEIVHEESWLVHRWDGKKEYVFYNLYSQLQQYRYEEKNEKFNACYDDFIKEDIDDKWFVNNVDTKQRIFERIGKQFNKFFNWYNITLRAQTQAIKRMK